MFTVRSVISSPLRSPLRAALRHPTLSKGGGVPPAWAGNAAYVADFLNDRYWTGRLSTLGLATSFSRSTVGDSIDSTGAVSQFAIDAMRKNDRGVLIEPAATNLIFQSNNFANAQWTKGNVTVGATSGGFTQILETATTAFHRMLKSSGGTIVNGNQYIDTWTVKKRGRRYLVVRITVELEGADKPATPRHVAMNWAQRLKRVFGIDIEACAPAGQRRWAIVV